MKNRIKELEQKIQDEIWRIQMIDYPTPNTNNELHKMQKELKDLTADSSDINFNNCKHENEKMNQEDGFVYVKCKWLGTRY